MRPLILLAILMPSARSCFDETRGGCFTAGFVDNLSTVLRRRVMLPQPSSTDAIPSLGAREVVGRDEALCDVRQDPVRFV